MAKKSILPISDSGESESILPILPALDLGGYKDELNLAEFPIAALTDRVPDGQTTLVFEDKLEQKDGPPIIRRLTIMAPSKHGLPTAMDDEVMVGLIQLTKRRNNYTEARVPFSRYELIELLGWPQNGQSYQRIEEALHRWVGVVLMYENAWWDNSAKSWVDENFHILENVSLYDRERRRRAAKPGAKAAGRGPVREGDPLPLSSFRWNEVIFRSFQSGNLKQLDLEFYLQLRLPTTKRMFRFLDKRFYRRDRLDFDLKTLACEHIGMSRSYKPTELKRRLRPALEELESLGFLETLPEAERYVWQGRGSWRIILVRGPKGRDTSTAAAAPVVDGAAEVAALLVARGVSDKAAAELVAAYPEAEVRARVDVFDWLMARSDKKVAKNPAGYLVASIKSRYAAPEGYSPPDEADHLAEAERHAAEDERKRRELERAETSRTAKKEADLKAKWEALDDAERAEITAQVKAENPGLRRWKAMMEPLCLAALDARGNTRRPVQETLFKEE
ncbi:MAG: Replication initiator protein [Actinomycetia bacterium]|nr:Replication initiator protein [Actinomycetes bacterium]